MATRDNNLAGFDVTDTDNEQRTAMANIPDGIVTVHLDEQRYRGAYYFRNDEIVVTAYGLKQKSINAEVLAGERGDAAINLAKLVLIDMVREVVDIQGLDPGLSLQGSTTAIYIP